MATESGWWKLYLSIDNDCLFESDLAHIAEQIKNGFTSGEIVETPKETLFDALTSYFKDKRIYYVGSMFGDPGEDVVLSGAEWSEQIKNMFGSDPQSFLWFDNHETRFENQDGFFQDGSNIFWKSGGRKESVFEILD